jgi:hypothetical protein
MIFDEHFESEAMLYTFRRVGGAGISANEPEEGALATLLHLFLSLSDEDQALAFIGVAPNMAEKSILRRKDILPLVAYPGWKPNQQDSPRRGAPGPG